MTLLLLSLLACADKESPADSSPVADPIGCAPEGVPMPLGSPEAFIDLWLGELSYELLDHLTLQYALESYAEYAIYSSVNAGTPPCPSIHYSDDGYDIDAGEGCEAADGTRWAGRVEVRQTEALHSTVYEGFAYAREGDDQGSLALEWTGSFQYGAVDGIAQLSVTGRREGVHDSSGDPAAGWAGRLEMTSDGLAERESYNWVVEENLQSASMVGGLCVIDYTNEDGDLEVRARGAEDLAFTWAGACASGAFDGQPFEGLCL